MDANDNLTPEEKEWILSVADVIAASSKKIDHIIQKLSYSFSTVQDFDVIKGLYAPLAGCEDFSPDMEKAFVVHINCSSFKGPYHFTISYLRGFGTHTRLREALSEETLSRIIRIYSDVESQNT